MTILVDTNILLRSVDQASAEHLVCVEALRTLDDRGDDLVICAQVMIEFWSVATRPAANNGLGLNIGAAERFLDQICNSMAVLPEPPDIAARWRRLVTTHSVISKQAHDARLVALMEAHQLEYLLTLNLADFKRFSGLKLLAPARVIENKSC